MTPELKEIKNVMNSCQKLISSLNEKFADRIVYYFNTDDTDVNVTVCRIVRNTLRSSVEYGDVKFTVDLRGSDSDTAFSTCVNVNNLRFSAEASFLEVTERSMKNVRKEFAKISKEDQ